MIKFCTTSGILVPFCKRIGKISTTHSIRHLQTFSEIKDPSNLLNLLKSRLPNSANVLNMATCHPELKKNIKFYAMDGSGRVRNDTWIFATYARKDYDQEICISAPIDPFKRVSPTQLQNEILESEIINWNKTYVFYALDPKISQTILDISWKIQGNSTRVVPEVFNSVKISDALACIDVGSLLGEVISRNPGHKIELMSLNSREGIDFIMTTWKFATAGSEAHLEELLKYTTSHGIYVNGEIACGAVQDSTGFIGMMATLPQHKKRGFGEVIAKAMVRSIAEAGNIPCYTAIKSNSQAQGFHQSIGSARSSLYEVDYISHIHRD